LQQAQAEVRSDPAHPEWAHPYYWAAFVLSGDPGRPILPWWQQPFRGLPLWAWAVGLAVLGTAGTVAAVLRRVRKAAGRFPAK
jgi:hypothetical protein